VRQRRMVPELRPSAEDVCALDIRDLNHDMGHPDEGESEPTLPFANPQITGVRFDLLDRIEIDLRQIVADAGAQCAGRCMKDESTSLGQSKLNSKTGRAKAGVPTQRGFGPVAVVVAHADVALAELLQEHDAVGADPGAARGERSDRLAILE